MTGPNGDLVVALEDGVLSVTFNRPDQHNAMTFAMYEGIHEACERADADDDIAVLVLRGAGGRAFISGTDIAQFRGFSGWDGVEYERTIQRVVDRLEDATVPTVAAVDGWCLGGGLVVAAVCDLRVATESARFGMPIARTLGNCLSMNNHSVLVSRFGAARTLDLVLRAEPLSATHAYDAGFVAEVCADGELDAAVEQVVATVRENAPLTMWAAKQAVARLRRAVLPDGDDLVERAFGSDDFAAAVRAFETGERTQWTGH